MILAKQLRKSNIAEYLLYMWQVEDIIRANGLDIDNINKHIISKYDQPADVKHTIREWYESFIAMMYSENVAEKGHLVMNNNTIRELTDLHNRILRMPKETDYIASYYRTLPFIVELRAKSADKDISEIETCFSALYGYLLMRLQHKDISGETQAAITQIGELLRILSMKYKEDSEKGLDN